MSKRPTKSKPPPDPELCPACVQVLDEYVRATEEGSLWLTAAGVRGLQRLLRHDSRHTAGRTSMAVDGLPLPTWDPASGRLNLGDRLLHEFHKVAPAQTAILDAFQAAGWGIEQVPNPLSPERCEDRADHQRRLENAVGNLNRRMPPGTLHFRLTRDRSGVRWEYATAPKRRRKRPR